MCVSKLFLQVEREIINRKKQKSNTSVCIRVKQCLDCSFEWKVVDGKHVCHTWKCHHCRQEVTRGEDHFCYMQPLQKNEDAFLNPAAAAEPGAITRKTASLIFYDLETRAEEVSTLLYFLKPSYIFLSLAVFHAMFLKSV